MNELKQFIVVVIYNRCIFVTSLSVVSWDFIRCKNTAFEKGKV